MDMTNKSYLFIFLFGLINVVSGYLESDGWVVIEMHHALVAADDGFTFRGNITIPSLNSGHCDVAQERLTTQQAIILKDLAKRNDFYRLRATVVYPNGAKQIYLTSAKACSIVKSQLNDVLWISIDESGFVTGITEAPSANGADGCNTFDEFGTNFDTDVLIRHTELAPVPDTASFIQKIEREREARERGEVRDNRGFFAKYWMYIVPVVLLVFISGATNQDGAK